MISDSYDEWIIENTDNKYLSQKSVHIYTTTFTDMSFIYELLRIEQFQ